MRALNREPRSETESLSRVAWTTRGQTALERAPAVHVVTGGAGTIRMEGFSRALSRGDYFFLPAAAQGALLATEGKLEIVECLPPAGQSEKSA